jgi:hypothetical protein
MGIDRPSVTIVSNDAIKTTRVNCKYFFICLTISFVGIVCYYRRKETKGLAQLPPYFGTNDPRRILSYTTSFNNKRKVIKVTNSIALFRGHKLLKNAKKFSQIALVF